MDVPIPQIVRQKRRVKRWVLAGIAGIGLVLGSLGLGRLQPAVPRVENAAIWIDTVRRGEMRRQVRGDGTLVPEEIHWIATINSGRVERILAWPGAAVKVDTVIVELRNAEVEQAAFDAEWQLKAGEADFANLRVQLASQKLTQEAAFATATADYKNAKLDLEVNEDLAKNLLVPALTLKQSRVKAEESAKLLKIEEERLRINADAARAQLAAQEAKVAQYRAQLELKRQLAEALKIRAGMNGVLQRLGDSSGSLQIGQQLAAGALVARVANSAKLKAAIRIAETQARDIQLDQFAEIDTRNGAIPGHVTRIDPAVEQNSVMVDIVFDAPLPKGARPDLSIDGTIEIERLSGVLYVGRPVQGQANSSAELFKIVDGGRGAVRVPVKLGRSSVSVIEVIQGLQAGDQIILSDMSRWETHDRLRLE